MKLLAAVLAALPLLFSGAAAAQNTALARDQRPECVLVESAFGPELEAVEAMLVPDAGKFERTVVNGVEFKSAQVGGRRIVFFLTGMSLVNAAMNTQLALDHFRVTAVFFTGIAGGIDPDLHPGDVVVPARWHYHSEAFYVNETTPGQFALPAFFKQKYLNFGMIFPEDVTVRREGMDQREQIPEFRADDQLLSAAQGATNGLDLPKLGDRACKVVYGGDGVSGSVFCDNAEYRQWVFRVWKAQCADMESASIAQVCWQNKTPCLVVRGLSDLAGGQTGANEMEQHLKAAADNSARVLVRILQNLDGPVH